MLNYEEYPGDLENKKAKPWNGDLNSHYVFFAGTKRAEKSFRKVSANNNEVASFQLPLASKRSLNQKNFSRTPFK